MSRLQESLACYKCLCEVCNMLRCPKKPLRRLSRNAENFSFCWSMMQRERCPVVKCDYFEHKQKRKYFRVVRRKERLDRLDERLADMQKLLEDIDGKLPFSD